MSRLLPRHLPVHTQAHVGHPVRMFRCGDHEHRPLVAVLEGAPLADDRRRNKATIGRTAELGHGPALGAKLLLITDEDPGRVSIDVYDRFRAWLPIGELAPHSAEHEGPGGQGEIGPKAVREALEE